MKKPTSEQRQRMCQGKRRYRIQGDALDAAMIAGVERQRQAYRCPVCAHWHLTSVASGRDQDNDNRVSFAAPLRVFSWR